MYLFMFLVTIILDCSWFQLDLWFSQGYTILGFVIYSLILDCSWFHLGYGLAMVSPQSKRFWLLWYSQHKRKYKQPRTSEKIQTTQIHRNLESLFMNSPDPSKPWKFVHELSECGIKCVLYLKLQFSIKLMGHEFPQRSSERCNQVELSTCHSIDGQWILNIR